MNTTDEDDELQDRIVDLMSNFGMGMGLLSALAEPNPTLRSREETLETFVAFEAAYGSLAALETDGKVHLDRGTRAVPAPIVLSDATFELVKQLGQALHLVPESPEAQGATAKIQAMADACLRALAPDWATSHKPTA